MTPDAMCRLMNDLLRVNDQIKLIVLPRLCSGLEDFPPDVPLWLNVGHALRPAMNIQTDELGTTFWASFSGVERTVGVPWAAVLFAGNEAALQETMARALKLQGPPAGATDNVRHVDFSRGRR